MSDGQPAASDYTIEPLVSRARRAAAARGVWPVAAELARWGSHAVAGLPRSVTGAQRRFAFQGDAYPYLYHRHKLTWMTERAVEVPIVQEIVNRNAGRRVLEIGNVLSHYRPQSHVVVDKYEVAPGVVNRDVLELDDLGPFDLIVAISTLEHVGWDEQPRDPDKAVAAVAGLRALLADGGMLVVTVPIGYNPTFDQAFRDGRIELSRSAALRRQGAGPRWREVAADDVWGVPYDSLLYSARAVLFAFIDCPSS